MKRRNFLCFGGSLALAAAAPVRAGTDNGASVFELTLPDTDGTDYALAQWRGKPLVVNFWATWCPPCVKEMPELDALHKAYGQVGFLGLAVDTAANVRRFAGKVQVAYPLLLLGYDGIQLMRSLGNKAGGLPFTLVLDKSGAIVQAISGPVDSGRLEQTLQTLL